MGNLWFENLDATAPQRPPLDTSTSADVAIVGAGYTGLWTAYYLLRANPERRVVVLDAHHAGFGASGRNGGWCSALFPRGLSALSHMPGSDRSQAMALHQAMRATVDEVGRAAAEEGIEADFVKGGSVYLARTPVQWRRSQEEVADARSWGRGEDDLQLLDQQQAVARLNATHTLGGVYTPDCARIQPAKLVRGLAEAVERLGGVIHEQTPVREITPGAAHTAFGVVKAPIVVRATEGYTPTLPGHRRTVVPVYSLIVATEPIAESVWDEIGLRQRETFNDNRHLIIYGQRTADNRLVFGGRGAPYHFGSTISPDFDRNERVFDMLRQTVRDMFPPLASVTFTHAWGGALGIPRDWCASVGLDAATGLAWAGGYVGDGVGTTNLAGRTLRDLIDGESTDLTELPWVNHHSPRWEPEPLRWAMINAGLKAMTAADHEENWTRRPSLAARVMSRFMGGH